MPSELTYFETLSYRGREYRTLLFGDHETVEDQSDTAAELERVRYGFRPGSLACVFERTDAAGNVPSHFLYVVIFLTSFEAEDEGEKIDCFSQPVRV